MIEKQAYESFQRFGKMFPGLLEAFQAWAEIGSLKQACEEQRGRFDKLKTDADKLALLRVEAEEKAKKIITDARDRSTEIIAAAGDKADRAKAKADADMDARAEIAAQHTAALAETVSHIETKQQELADVNELLKEAKAAHAHSIQAHQAFLAAVGAK